MDLRLNPSRTRVKCSKKLVQLARKNVTENRLSMLWKLLVAWNQIQSYLIRRDQSYLSLRWLTTRLTRYEFLEPSTPVLEWFRRWCISGSSLFAMKHSLGYFSLCIRANIIFYYVNIYFQNSFCFEVKTLGI